ncbi:MAG: FAD-dependent oxidoreductase [Rhodospirillaceae bacterium]|nr:FAD-dependent oxidoreductase [Rhodospirillaceae bacterium]
MAQFSHLLAPGKIGKLELRNRIFLSPMGSNLADEDGITGERIRAYYTARAKGGAALITMGSVSIGYPEGTSNIRQESIAEERHIPGVKALADAVHAHGAKLALQLVHAGLVAMNDMLAGRAVWCPSVPKTTKESGDMAQGFLPEEAEIFFAPFKKMGPPKYKVMDAQDIEQLVQMFAGAAERAKRAGADAVEIHAGHGYIISTFLSPAYNQRTDAYGGSIENRTRLLCDVIKGVRAAVGPDFPIWARLDAREHLMDDGITLEDAKTAAYLAQEAGLDAIHVSAHGHTGKGATFTTGQSTHTPGGFVENAAAIKGKLRIPVITVGRLEPEMADRCIGAGKFDFVAMARKLLADPELPNKLKEGRADDVRPCIYCYTCISQIFFSKHVICAVNPATGFEHEGQTAPAAVKKHVVVVGGGPAGMEAARRLALRGHKVTLLEQSDRLGGTAQFASIAYAANERIVNWLKGQLAKSSVDIRYNTTATAEALKAMAADEVIVATGATRSMPDIPGATRANVFSGDDMRRLVLGQDMDRLAGKTSLLTRLAMKVGDLTGLTKSPGFIRLASRVWMPLGKRVVIIGGELVGLELAEFLAERGREVTVIDEAAKFGTGLQVVRRWRVLADLHELGVTLVPEAREIAIGDKFVSYVNPNSQTRSLMADHVIVAQGAQGEVSLAESLKNAGFVVHVAGDCTGVGYINKAIADAARIAAQI